MQNIPKFLWPEVVTHAAQIQNQSYTRSLSDDTLEGKWSNCKLDILHLCELGIPVWILNEALDWSKLDPKSDKHTFIGYQDGPKAIKYYDVCTHLVKVSRNYTFQIETAPQANIPALDVQCEGESTGSNVP